MYHSRVSFDMSRFGHGTTSITPASMMQAYIVQPAISFIAESVACTCTLPFVDMAAMCCASVSLLP